MKRLLKTMAEELIAWRANLVNMRGTNDSEVDAVIDQLDRAIETVSALRAADKIAKVVR